MGWTTLLEIDGVDLGPYAARDLDVTLSMIKEGTFKRTVNGRLVSLIDSSFKKYAVKIGCTDMAAPSLNDVFWGKEVYLTLIEGMGVEDPGYDVLHLAAMIVDWSVNRNERTGQVTWSIEFEER